MAITFEGSQITVRPNNSLSAVNGLKLLIALAILALLIALAFVRIGAWLVLPFAGLELVAFAYAFHYLSLRADDFEKITIDEKVVTVEKHGYKHNTKAEFQRYWAQVNLRIQPSGLRGLFIGSHGKEVEFGRGYISQEQMTALAKELKVLFKKQESNSTQNN